MGLAVLLLSRLTAGAQPAPPPTAAPRVSDASESRPRGAGLDLQGIWDFTMRVGDRSSPGFIAIGPVEQGWAGSITMYLTNTLAVRPFAVTGDSVHMVVASREGDVRFVARLSGDGRLMEGIVEYHGGARLPMMAIRRPQPAVPR